MDGDPRAGNMGRCASSKVVSDAWNHYYKQGVDGIFFYQGDQYTANPYLKYMIKQSEK
jgi:hypothetical protein